jgi:hypothetical protein
VSQYIGLALQNHEESKNVVAYEILDYHVLRERLEKNFKPQQDIVMPSAGKFVFKEP